MSTIINLPERPKIRIKDSNLYFPISRVFGIGRNYSERIETENKDIQKTVLFMKDAYRVSPAEEGIFYPKDTTQLRYEIEMVVAIAKGGDHLSIEEAGKHIYGYGVGIDFTKYDAQDRAKQHGLPWDLGKSFLGCAPCSPIIPQEKVILKNNSIWLKKNGVEVQRGSLEQMIYNVNEIVALISSQFGLLAGDIIFTGTPQGIGMAEKGDELEGGIDGITTLHCHIN